MKLHDNKQSFREAIELTAQDLEIYPEFVEKDYWICQILQNLSRNPASGKDSVEGRNLAFKGIRLDRTVLLRC